MVVILAEVFNDLQNYVPDDAERAVPDAVSAVRLLEARLPQVLAALTTVAEHIGAEARAHNATVLATTRLALRHGRLGTDFHDYHNEQHVLELAERRLLRLVGTPAPTTIAREDLTALLLFSACHDLRQREPRHPSGPIGGNEWASIAETLRILVTCGFDPVADRELMTALPMMIAGSTFDTRPLHADALEADDMPVLAGGAFARGLGLWLDNRAPYWREDPAALRGERLARLAADLDTGNVGEAFDLFCDTAVRLCRERELRAGRDLESAASAAPCLAFLGLGQQHYFFELHRFCSREGERTFGPSKQANAARVRQTTAALLAQFASQPPAHGLAVIRAFGQCAATA